MPHDCGKKWNVYLWVYDNSSCYQVRGLNPEEQLAIASRRRTRSAPEFLRMARALGVLGELHQVSSSHDG
jgi:hypothetical protein